MSGIAGNKALLIVTILLLALLSGFVLLAAMGALAESGIVAHADRGTALENCNQTNALSGVERCSEAAEAPRSSLLQTLSSLGRTIEWIGLGVMALLVLAGIVRSVRTPIVG